MNLRSIALAIGLVAYGASGVISVARQQSDHKAQLTPRTICALQRRYSTNNSAYSCTEKQADRDFDMTQNLTAQEQTALEHWSMYGQPGESPKERVTADGWKTKPMLKPITSTWDQKVPLSELTKMLNGLQPRDMEDKWFVYTDGPDTSGIATVHFARSWTGFILAEVKMQITKSHDSNEMVRFTEIVWESSTERYRSQGEQGVKKMVIEVLKWCLDVKL